MVLVGMGAWRYGMNEKGKGKERRQAMPGVLEFGGVGFGAKIWVWGGGNTSFW